MSIDKQYRYLYFITKAQNIVAEICIQSEIRANFSPPSPFFFVFTKMHRKAISLYVVTKGDWATDQHNEGTVYRRRKLWIAFVPRSRFLQTPGIKRQCRRMNEKYHKGDGRTELIDQGGSRGQRRHAFAAKEYAHVHRAAHFTPLPPSPRAPYRGVPQERDKTREKPSMAHLLNCTSYAHVHVNVLC